MYEINVILCSLLGFLLYSFHRAHTLCSNTCMYFQFNFQLKRTCYSNCCCSDGYRVRTKTCAFIQVPSVVTVVRFILPKSLLQDHSILGVKRCARSLSSLCIDEEQDRKIPTEHRALDCAFTVEGHLQGKYCSRPCIVPLCDSLL